MCPRCGVIGVLIEREGAVCCVECAWKEDLRKRIIRRNLERAGLMAGPAKHMSLATFQRREKRHRIAYGIVSEWLDGFPHTQGESVLLWSSGYGTGKTHLARGIQRTIIMGGGTASFYLVADMLAAIRATYGSNGGKSESDIIGAMQQSQLLIWDDLGKEYVREASMPWFHNIVFQVVDARHRAGRSMVVTSNVRPKALPALIGGASASRLMEMVGGRIADMTGPDWRMR